MIRRINKIRKNIKPDKTIPKDLECPSCSSSEEELSLKETRQNNGIIGSGFASWVVDSYYSCKNCGTRFDKIN